jgi:hypothetical protein
MQSQEHSRLIAIRGALVTMTNTPGWAYVKQLANSVVQKAVQDALDAEDSIKGEAKRLKASALQKGFTDLFKAVEITKAFDPESTDDGGLGELEITHEER